MYGCFSFILYNTIVQYGKYYFSTVVFNLLLWLFPLIRSLFLISLFSIYSILGCIHSQVFQLKMYQLFSPPHASFSPAHLSAVVFLMYIQHCSSSSASSFHFCYTFITILNRRGLDTDPWCNLMFTWNFPVPPIQHLTLVFTFL